MQKKYIWNIRKPLVLGSCEWILRMIKLNNYLEFFPVPDSTTTMKIPREEFVDVLEDRVLYQWKLEFKKERFDLSSSTLKEFLDVCVHLEEAEMQKLLKKKTACAIKEHDNSDGKKPKLRHKSLHGLSKRYEKCLQNKHYGGKHKKKICDYHDLCYHDTDKCNFLQDCRKHVQPTYRAKRHAKRCGLTGKEVKDLNAFVKDKINETIKERNRNMHTMSNLKDLSISSSNESIQGIIISTSDEELDSDSCKPAHKK
eukprot:228075-Ditylum_brightwellii.AAC.1